MNWEGLKIKEISTLKGFSVTKVAHSIGVSRQTVNDWINGQIPKGHHLLQLCKLFDVSPDFFFENTISQEITIPVHRNRMNAKITGKTHEAAMNLSKDFLNLFKNQNNSFVVPVIRIKKSNRENAEKIGNQLRHLASISADSPMDYESTFDLLGKLGIFIIFRSFPDSIKSYAFYTCINDHRVVFVNSSTNIIDAIFPLLHEAVHAIRDENTIRDNGYGQQEEDFCDLVAAFVQFPKTYVEFIYSMIKDMEIPAQVNTLKKFARKNQHSIFGIVKTIKLYYPDFYLNVGGADSNLRKEFPTLDNILYENTSTQNFIEKQKQLSPLFFNIIQAQINDLSFSKLAEIYGITTLDAKEMKEEMLD